MNEKAARTRDAVLAAFSLFAAMLLAVGRAEASLPSAAVSSTSAPLVSGGATSQLLAGEAHPAFALGAKLPVAPLLLEPPGLFDPASPLPERRLIACEKAAFETVPCPSLFLVRNPLWERGGLEAAGNALQHLNHARNYRGSLRRFNSPDKLSGKPEDPQSWNRYTYARNNPLKYVDPNGLDAILFVRNAGSGITNFGHVALRIYGKGYDVTYDFGRYHGGTGPLSAKGPGILRVWDKWGAFLGSQSGHGTPSELRWKTSPEFDKAVMSQFDQEIKAGTKTNDGHGGAFTEYQLKDDYDLRGNNCTTQCLNGLFSAESSTGTQFGGLEMFRGQNDPRDLFKELQQSAVTPEQGKTYDPGTILRVCPDGTHCHYEMK